MKEIVKHLVFVFLVVAGVFSLQGCNNESVKFRSERTVLFDEDWLFMREDVPDGQSPDLDDSKWRKVDVPHDWSIEDLPGPDTGDQIGPFSKNSPGTTSTGYVIGGTGWYRKQFVSPADVADHIYYLQFDGVYMASHLWINGQKVGFKAHGYSPFYYDITPFLKPAGENNLFAMQVNNTGENSRWYSGSGIYRHVWLSKVDPLHIDIWGVYITTPEVSEGKAVINTQVKLKNTLGNSEDIQVRIQLFNMEGDEVATAIENLHVEAQSTSILNTQTEVINPALWSVEDPALYTSIVKVFRGNDPIDEVKTKIGIRSLVFSAEKGFQLNGKSILLKGGCMHHDNGLLGAAAFDAAEERRVRIMKENGFNAIRTAHNPPSSAFLDACDKLGVLVIDEAFDRWEKPKRPQDYHQYFAEHWKEDLTSFILRDRNHPSIIIWSIGNEIPERADTLGIRVGKKLIETVRALDDTRPVTNAICAFWDNPGWEWPQSAPAFEILDIGGYNYQWQRYASDHEKNPERIMMGTESVAKEAFENWQEVKNNPYVIGDFVWTSMDYLGETGIGHSRYLREGGESSFALPWPWYNAWCGDIDIIGNKKPQSYYRDVVWEESTLEMLVHAPVPAGKSEYVSFWGWPDEHKSWNWEGSEGELLEVNVYTRYPKVRLMVNGETIGEMQVSDETRLTATFSVPYQPGELKAVGIENGEEKETVILRTTGELARLQLTPKNKSILADRSEIVYVTIDGIDEQGLLVNKADNRITFQVSGPAEILAAGNAKPNEMENFQDNECNLFMGNALVILRSTGEKGDVILTASSGELENVECSIHMD